VNQKAFGWFGIFRLGLVQAAIGSIVVLTTSTMNRIMVVELALPAVVPGALVGLHYAIQFLRPVWGHGSDLSRRRTPWIVGGVLTLAAGAVLASSSIALMGENTAAGLALAILAFILIGAGVGVAGTSLLALLAARTDEYHRAGAATAVWLMMIAGIAITAIAAGKFLDPYTPSRLFDVTVAISICAMLLACVALWNVEPKSAQCQADLKAEPNLPFRGLRAALEEVWADEKARRFTIFVFVSMLAYSAQDLILEPYAGQIFGLTPGQSTELSGIQHGGVFAGMLLVGVLGRLIAPAGGVGIWSIWGCFASSAALIGLAIGAFIGPPWPVSANVFSLGFSNGVFAVAAIGSMMALAKDGRAKSEGVRMGVWGAAQGLAFGLGGFLGTVAVDVARGLSASSTVAYAVTFFLEAMLFLASAYLAFGLARGHSDPLAHLSLASSTPVGKA
jgi:MFS transporter, BCD family, chlorophyll transporter